MKIYFAKNLKYLRAQEGLSQESMADRLKITRSAYGAYEEERNEPSLERLTNICKYFDVSIDWMLTLNMEKQSVA